MYEPGFLLRCSAPFTPGMPVVRAQSRVIGPGWELHMRGRESLATTANGRVHCAWVGYVENHDELVRRLDLPASVDDGVILATAYERWGDAFASEVIGELAFVLVDAAAARVVAVRSDLGTRRLVWWRSNDDLVVASSVGLVLDALPAAPALDDHAVAEFVHSGGLLSAERTIYAGVKNLQAAHTLVRDATGETTITRYWRPSAQVLGLSTDYDAELRERLSASVAAAMAVDGAIGVDVSGGLDSSTVAAAAARVAHGRSPVAYSIVHSPGSDRDESRYQTELCAAYSLERVTFDADAHTDFDVLNVDALAEPSTQILQGTRVRAGQVPLERRGVVVQLSGLGGDQVFCGDGFPPVHLASLLRTTGVRAWKRELDRWLDRGDRSAFDLIWRCTRSPLAVVGSGVEIRPPTWIRPAVSRRIEEVRRDDHERDRTFTDGAAEYQWRAMTDIAACAYRCATRFDMRYPLMSRRIAELVLALPWAHKVTATQDRVIQRRALAGWIPDLIRLRSDKGDVTGRIFEGLRANWSVVRPLADGDRLADLGVVDKAAFRQCIERMRHGLTSGGLGYLFGGLALEAWLRLREEHPRARDPMACGIGATP